MPEKHRKHFFVAFAVLGVILLLYVGSYFALVRRGVSYVFPLDGEVHTYYMNYYWKITPISYCISGIKPFTVRGRIAIFMNRFYGPLHQLDRNYIRPNYWDDKCPIAAYKPPGKSAPQPSPP